MSSVTTCSLSDDISEQDALEFSQDIIRMIRRARAAKQSRMFIRTSAENLVDVLNAHLDASESASFSQCWDVIAENPREALRAIGPYRGFFTTNGLLPGEVRDAAHVAFILIQAEQLGLLSFA